VQGARKILLLLALGQHERAVLPIGFSPLHATCIGTTVRDNVSIMTQCAGSFSHELFRGSPDFHPQVERVSASQPQMKSLHNYNGTT